MEMNKNDYKKNYLKLKKDNYCINKPEILSLNITENESNSVITRLKKPGEISPLYSQNNEKNNNDNNYKETYNISNTNSMNKKDLTFQIFDQMKVICKKYYSKGKNNNNFTFNNESNVRDFYTKNMYETSNIKNNKSINERISPRNLKKQIPEETIIDLRQLQEYYYQINERNNYITDSRDNNNYINQNRCNYGDYAVNKTIFNHPQLYLLSNNNIKRKYNNYIEKNKTDQKLPPIVGRTNSKHTFTYKKVNNFSKLIPKCNSNNEQYLRAHYCEFLKGRSLEQKMKNKIYHLNKSK